MCLCLVWKGQVTPTFCGQTWSVLQHHTHQCLPLVEVLRLKATWASELDHLFMVPGVCWGASRGRHMLQTMTLNYLSFSIKTENNCNWRSQLSGTFNHDLNPSLIIFCQVISPLLPHVLCHIKWTLNKKTVPINVDVQTRRVSINRSLWLSTFNIQGGHEEQHKKKRKTSVNKIRQY